MSVKNPALVIFIKNPKRGKVKTRLANSIGDEAAYQAYLMMLKHTRDICLETDVEKYLFYSDGIEDDDMWDVSIFHKMSQYGKNLGKRMIHAMSYVLTIHDAAIIIGSDCAELTSDILKNALNGINRADAVIGPSFDGGYYLFGLKEFEKYFFTDIDWSTDMVFQQTMTKLKSRSKSVVILDQLNDVDTIHEWNLVKKRLKKKYGLHSSEEE
jgi:rSAM/selenodomain-associated transferase 1